MADQALRALAIFLEVVVLTGIIYCILNGARLILADFGIGPKYNKAIVMALVAVGGLLVVFFSTHLSTFYPTI
jgi:succinate dehydrogenase/fumarate reductase cytochrome b subunit